MAVKNEIILELENLSPYLAALPREHPFTVPEDYFDEAAEIILMAATHSGSLVAPASFKAIEHPFKVPDGYFEELPNNILFQAKQQNAKNDEHKVVPIRRFSIKKTWLIAASVVALLVTTLVVKIQQQASSVIPDNTVISATVLENNMMVEVADLDEEVIVELLIEDEAGAGAPADPAAFYDPSLIDVTDIDDEFLDEI